MNFTPGTTQPALALLSESHDLDSAKSGKSDSGDSDDSPEHSS
jgi:hypothetical protein